MSSKEVLFRDLGTMAYGECWALQQQLFEQMLLNKKEGLDEIGGLTKERVPDKKEGLDRDGGFKRAGYILMVEHPSVYTLGKSGKETNVLFGEEQLKALGAEFYHIDRGGDITFHGKGQIVLYPILDLEEVGISLKEYISALEQAVIETVAHWGVKAERIAGAAGVWISSKAPSRKICAIGVKSSRYITMHGLAMNVSTDLNFFNFINPCGFTDRGVTSLEVECGSKVSISEVKELLLNNLIKILNVKIYKK